MVRRGRGGGGGGGGGGRGGEGPRRVFSFIIFAVFITCLGDGIGGLGTKSLQCYLVTTFHMD